MGKSSGSIYVSDYSLVFLYTALPYTLCPRHLTTLTCLQSINTTHGHTAGNALNELERDEEPPELRLPPEEIYVPKVPRELVTRQANKFNGQYHLGDFFYLVDLEEERRHAIHMYLPSHYKSALQPSQQAGKAHKPPGPLERVIRASGGRTSAGQVDLPAVPVPAPKRERISFGIRLLRDFLKRMGGATISNIVVSQALSKGMRAKRGSDTKYVVQVLFLSCFISALSTSF